MSNNAWYSSIMMTILFLIIFTLMVYIERTRITPAVSGDRQVIQMLSINQQALIKRVTEIERKVK